MSRTPGRRTDEPDSEDLILQVDEIDLQEIGRTLIELGEQLRKIGELTEGRHILKDGVVYSRNAYETMTEEEVEEENAKARAAFRETLTGLRKFRRNYDFWERIVAEYALSKMGYTQRDAAKLLGVGVSTINRWAQNPLAVQDYS